MDGCLRALGVMGAKNLHLSTERSWHLPHLGSSHETPELHPEPEGAGAGTGTPCLPWHPLPALAPAPCQPLPRGQGKTQGKVWGGSSQHCLPKGRLLAVREASLFTEQMDFGAGKHLSM